MLSAPESSAELVKLEALISLLEENLRCERFHIAQRDAAALLELLPRYLEVRDAIQILLSTLPIDADRSAAYSARIAAAEAARLENARTLDDLVAGMRKELRAMQTAGAKLRQLRRDLPAGLNQREAAPTRCWA